MKDLDLLGPDADGAHLTLADADGQRYRLRITDALRSAMRTTRQPATARVGRSAEAGMPGGATPSPALSLSPREIQVLLRSGISIADVAQRSGADVRRIESYAAPIEAERAYIAQRAQGLRVGHVSDAPNLGDLVVDRLASREVAAEDIQWDAVRRERHPWEVVVTFPIGGSTREARWSVDLARHVLTATDDESRWLSETDIGHQGRRRGASENLFSSRAPLRSAPPGPSSAQDEREELLEHLAASRGTRVEVQDPELEEEEVSDQHRPDADGSGDQHRSAGGTSEETADELASEGAQTLARSIARSAGSAGPAATAGPAAPAQPESAQDSSAQHGTAAAASPGEAAVLSLTERQHRSRAARPQGSDPAPEERSSSGAPSPAGPGGGDPPADRATERATANQEPAAEQDMDATQDTAAEQDQAAEQEPPAEHLLDISAPKSRVKKKGSRRSVPSWDEIVFGTRSDG